MAAEAEALETANRSRNQFDEQHAAVRAVHGAALEPVSARSGREKDLPSDARGSTETSEATSISVGWRIHAANI
jgi:hypothetical protein